MPICTFNRDFRSGKIKTDCRNGDKCKFTHLPADKPTEILAPPPSLPAKGLYVKRNKHSVASLYFDCPVKIAKEEPGASPRLDAARILNIPYIVEPMVDKRTHTNMVGHEVDGQVVRPYTTTKALGTGLRHVEGLFPGLTTIKLADLWGSGRTVSTVEHLNREAKKRFGVKHDMVDIKVYTAVLDGKDLLRAGMNGTVSATNEDVLNFIDREKPHLLFIQDVQQYGSTSQNNLFDYVIKGNCPLVMTFHREVGEMGFKGMGGFWLRQGECITVWPSLTERPYFDTEDFGWCFDTNSAKYKGVHFTWSVENITSNVFFLLLTVRKMPFEQRAEFPDPFVVKDFPKTNTSVYDPFDNSWWDQWTQVHEVVKKCIYEPVSVKTFQTYLSSTPKSMTDHAILGHVTKLFEQDARFAILALRAPDAYQELITYTAVDARKKLVQSQLNYTDHLRTDASRVARIIDNFRNSHIVNQALNPLFLFGLHNIWLTICTGFYWTLMVCYYVVKTIQTRSVSSVKHLIQLWFPGSQFLERVFTSRDYVLTIPPPEFSDSLYAKSTVDFLGVYQGIYKWGVLQLPVRYHVQTPPPEKLRGLESEGIQLVKDRHVVSRGLPAYDAFSCVKTESRFSVCCGPSPVPFHFNADSPGGRIGMIRALLTPVNVSQDKDVFEEATPEDHAKGWKTLWQWPLLIPDRYLRMREPALAITHDERVAWCESKDKRALYLGALQRVVDDPDRITQAEFLTVSLKSKTNEALLKDKERIIVNVSPEVAVMTAPEVELATARAKTWWSPTEVEQNQITVQDKYRLYHVWGSGTSPEDRGHVASYFSTIGPNCIGVMDCGDDMVGVVNIQGHRLFCEGDASNWDHSQTEAFVDGAFYGALRTEYMYYAALGIPNETIQLLHKVNRAEVKVINPDNPNEYVKFSLRTAPRRQSGEAATTLGNGIGTGHAYTAVMLEFIEMIDKSNEDYSKDDLKRLLTSYMVNRFKRLGHRLKFRTFDCIEETTFLRGFFVPCRHDGDGHLTHLWMISPEVVAKLGHCCVDPNTRSEYRMLVGANAAETREMRCYQHVADVLYAYSSFAAMPILGTVIDAIPSLINLTHVERMAAINASDKWDRPAITTVGYYDYDFTYVMERLGISPEEEASFDEMVRSTKWNAGLFYVHPVFSKLAAVYV